jgi:hypothetical protein
MIGIDVSRELDAVSRTQPELCSCPENNGSAGAPKIPSQPASWLRSLAARRYLVISNMPQIADLNAAQPAIASGHARGTLFYSGEQRTAQSSH